MALIFEFPLLNPLKAIFQSDKLPSNISYATLNTFNPSFNHKWENEDFYYRTLKSYEQKECYLAPYQQCDTVEVKFFSSIGTLATFQYARLLDANGKVYTSKSITVILEAGTYSGLYLYTVRFKLYDVKEGKYFLQLIHDNVTTAEMVLFEPFHVKQNHPNTIRYDYHNTYNTQGFIFGDGTNKLQLRVKGDIKVGNNSTFNVYEDQGYNVEAISGTPFREIEVTFGTRSSGIPQWVADKIERISLLDSNSIDGVALTRADGAKLEPKNKIGANPLNQYTLKLRDKENQTTTYVYDSSIVMGDMPQTSLFWVERIRIATSYLNIRLPFYGKRNFLDYLNSSLQTANGYWSENANNKLVFVPYPTYTPSGTWDLASADVLKYAMKFVLIGVGDIEVEIDQVGTGENYAVFYDDLFTSTNKTAIANSPSTTTIVKTYTSKGTKDFIIFVSNAKSIVDSATNINAVSFGGDLPPSFLSFEPFSGAMQCTYMENNMFKFVTALNNLRVNCNLDMYTVNQVIHYIVESLTHFNTSATVYLSGQTLATGPSVSDMNMMELISQIRTYGITLSYD